MDTQEPHEIGAKRPYTQPEVVRDNDHEVLMTFENIESIDALISSLQDVKKTMNIKNASSRCEFNARCNAIIDKLFKLHGFLTNIEEHILALTCMELIDSINTNILDADLSREYVGESLFDIHDTVKSIYYNDATPANETICPELLVMINNLMVDLVDLI